MTQSNGFVVKSQEDKVCKLQKSFHEKFDVTLISADFSINEVDRCVLPP
jgi:hypothetical protein